MTWSTVHSDRDTSKLHWRSRLRKLNFLRPLVIFWPKRRHYTPTTAQDVIDAPLHAPTVVIRTMIDRIRSRPRTGAAC